MILLGCIEVNVQDNSDDSDNTSDTSSSSQDTNSSMLMSSLDEGISSPDTNPSSTEDTLLSSSVFVSSMQDSMFSSSSAIMSSKMDTLSSQEELSSKMDTLSSQEEISSIADSLSSQNELSSMSSFSSAMLSSEEDVSSSSEIDISNFNIGTGCDCDLTQYDFCKGTSIVKTIVGTRLTDKQVSWTFFSGQEPAYCGQFANGDYWVAPAKGQTSVTIAEVAANGDEVHVDANPSDPKNQGVLPAYGHYNEDEDLINKLPVTYDKITSVLAAVRRNEEAEGNCGTKQIVGACLSAVHVLTVMDKIPDGRFGRDMLRPHLVNDEKNIVMLSDIALDRIPSFHGFEASAAHLNGIANTWSHTVELFKDAGSEGGRAFRSSAVVNDYGTHIYNGWHGDVYKIFSSNMSLAEKTKAIAAMMTYGQDCFYGFMSEDGPLQRITSGAGQSTGLTAPCYLFAAFMKDPSYRQRSATFALDPGAESVPQEIKQVRIFGNGTIPTWGDSTNMFYQRHWAGIFFGKCYDGAVGECITTKGKKTVRDPYGYIDGPEPKPGSNYMSVTIAAFRVFAAQIQLVPEMCEAFNYPILIDYVNRVHEHGVWTKDDPCAPPDPREVPECNPYNDRDKCLYYGLSANAIEKTWGPDPDDLTQCIPNNSGSNTGQNGRFPHVDGASMNNYSGGSPWIKYYDEIAAASTCGK